MKTAIFILTLFLFTTSVFPQPISLKDSSNQFDYVIITQDDFVGACQNFKTHKETVRNFSVLITTPSKILAEFNSYENEQDNIRDFISFAGTKWQTPEVKYFLLVGNTKQIPNFKFISVPGYAETDTSYSDYYYGIDKHSEDTTKIDYYVGRISANDTTELQNYFNKIIDYENDKTVESWQNNSLFLADDRKTPNSYVGTVFEGSAISVGNAAPSFINKKYFFESDSSEFFGTTDSIVSYINTFGTSSIFFSGFGNSSKFTDESYFTINDVARLKNNAKPFFASFTFPQKFSTDTSTSMLDQMLFSESGAICGAAPVGVSFYYINVEKNIDIWNNLYNDRTVGEVFTNALNLHYSRENWKMNLFGDPSVILKSNNITSVNNNPNLKHNFILEQNYPNPFNPSTVIKYNIPFVERDLSRLNQSQLKSALQVTLKIYDILGREVATLVNEKQKPGNYEVEWTASEFPSGVYFYQLTAGEFTNTKKLILLK